MYFYSNNKIINDLFMDVDEIEIIKFRFFKYLLIFENCPYFKAIKVTYLSQIVMNFKL